MKKILSAYALLLLLCWLAYALHSHGLLESISPLIVPAYLLIAAFWLTAANPKHYGTTLGNLLAPATVTQPGIAAALKDFLSAIRQSLPSLGRALVFSLVLSLIVFPLYALGWYLWMRPATPFAFQLRPEFVDFAATQFLIVALPEEAFFRGYVQTSLSDLEKRRIRLLGVDVAPLTLIAQSVMFALVHMIGNGEVSRLAVFFPGLLFGWIRARSNGIGAAVIFHALCNIFSYTLLQSWYP